MHLAIESVGSVPALPQEAVKLGTIMRYIMVKQFFVDTNQGDETLFANDICNSFQKQMVANSCTLLVASAHSYKGSLTALFCKLIYE